MPDPTLPNLLLDVFFPEGLDRHAEATLAGGTTKYLPIEGKPSFEKLVLHLEGKAVLGAYQLTNDSMVSWVGWDVDSEGDLNRAKVIAEDILRILGDMPCLVEYSGSKGYHILLLLDGLYPAEEAKILVEAVRSAASAPVSGNPHVETYPKQSKLRRKGFGNLLKLPLGIHPKTGHHSIFVDPELGWEEGPAIPPVEVLLQRTSLETLRDLVFRYEEGLTLEQEIVNLIRPHREPGQGHELILHLSGFLCFMGWEQVQTESLIETLCEATGDDDLENRLQSVRDTYDRKEKGQRISGMDSLGEMLPQSVLRDLARLAGSLEIDENVGRLDDIRLQRKTPPFLRVRSAGKLVCSYLQERGRIVNDQGEVLWLDMESKNLIPLVGDSYEKLLHKSFGINPEESFGRQLMREAYLMAEPISEPVRAYRRSYWDGQVLQLNLGSKEVYRVDGNGEIDVVYNGEEGVVFRNAEDPLKIGNILDMDLEPVSPWPYLTDDISFSSVGTGTSEDEQREMLKAWILCTFFGQAMPTRPILACLGTAGSGKTTTARRIIKILEGPDEEVKGVVTDKPDSLRATFTHHKIAVLDNLEKTRAHWLSDMLNRVSTGTDIEIRQLYQTNAIYRMKPDIFIICTAIEMPFSEESIYSRLLPLEMQQLLKPKPEFVLQKDLRGNLEGIWKGFFGILDGVVSELVNNQIFEAPTSSRLADFTSFCYRARGIPSLEADVLMSGLMSLGDRQRRVLADNSPLIGALEMWLRQAQEEALKWHTANELSSILSHIADRNRLEWRWTTPQGFGRHLTSLESQLERMFGLQARDDYDTSRGRAVKQYRFEKHMVDVGTTIVH